MAAGGKFGSMAISSLMNFNRQTLLRSRVELLTPIRLYAIKKPAAAAGKLKGMGSTATIAKYKLQPEMDTEILHTHLCGGNVYKEGEDPVLKPDSEYPDWLWGMNLDRQGVLLEDLEEDTMEYWRKLVKMDKKRRSIELSLSYKQHRFSSPPALKRKKLY